MSIDKKASKPAQVVKPCFAYPGGKRKLLPHILPLVPEHKTYVEPFAGGLAVLLAKERSQLEVVNDYNPQVANFYRYVRYHRDALFCELENQLNSREDFNLMRENPGMTDLQRAVHWYMVKVNSFGGQSEHYGRGRSRNSGYDRRRHMAMIDAVSERLAGVVVENRDWEEVVTFYDNKDAFFFFDPPYVNSSKTAYEPFSEFEMERVRARLEKLKGKYLLTCDDSPQCRQIFKGLPFRSIKLKYSLSNAATTSATTRKTVSNLFVTSPKMNKGVKAA